MIGAAAARAQALRLQVGLQPLSWNGLARMLYLTGIDLCRESGRLPVRRLDVARLERGVTRCPALVECALSIASENPLPPNILNICAAQLGECGLESVVRGQLLRACPRVADAPIEWPLGYGDGYASCGTAAPHPPVNVATCGSLCPYESVPSRIVLGSLGPQPNAGGCPDCELSVKAALQVADLTAEISTSLPAGAMLTSPYVLVSGTDPASGQIVKHYIFFDTSEPWKAGEIHKVNFAVADVNVDWSKASASLISTITTPGPQTGTDISPLRVEVQ